MALVYILLVLAFMHLYSTFNLRLFLSIFVFYFLKSGIETPDRKGQWFQHLLTLFAFFFNESNTKETNLLTFGLCFNFVKCACFVLFSTFSKDLIQ